MPELTFRGWRLEYDSEATARAYAAARPCGPEECLCSYCKNLIAAREEAYPDEFKRLAATVGVTPLTETETWELGAAERDQNVRLYGGFFHFVGKIMEAPEQVPGRLTADDIRPGAVVVSFSEGRDLLPQSFGEVAVVQVQFYLRVPWLLSEPPGE